MLRDTEMPHPHSRVDASVERELELVATQVNCTGYRDHEFVAIEQVARV